MQEIAAKFVLACEQALLFGRAKRASRERASERRSRETRFARSIRRACSRAKFVYTIKTRRRCKSLAKSTFRVSTRFTSLLFPVRTSTVATVSKEGTMFTFTLAPAFTHNLQLSS